MGVPTILGFFFVLFFFFFVFFYRSTISDEITEETAFVL